MCSLTGGDLKPVEYNDKKTRENGLITEAFEFAAGRLDEESKARLSFQWL